MDNGILTMGPGEAAGRRPGLRVGSVLLALALMFAAVVLVQQRAEAAPASAAVAAVVAAVPAGAAVAPQIDIAALIRAIVCPILLSLRSGPFAAFFGGIVNSLAAAFGCTAVSGAQ